MTGESREQLARAREPEKRERAASQGVTERVTRRRTAQLQLRGATAVGQAGEQVDDPEVLVRRASDPLNDLSQGLVALELMDRMLTPRWRTAFDPSHSLVLAGESGDLVFCKSCGHLASTLRKADGLKALCERDSAAGKAAQNRSYRLKKFLEGKHPDTGELCGNGTLRAVPRDWGTADAVGEVLPNQ